MKRLPFVLALVLSAMILPWQGVVAQQPTKPDTRFAIRLNTLSLLNLSPVIELEYQVGTRIGILGGGGLGAGAVYPAGIARFRNAPENCKKSGWAAYSGIRVGLPVGKLVGLSIKAIASYSHFQESGWGCYGVIELPPYPDPYVRNRLGVYGCVAYAQTFAKRLFIEPVIGIGPNWTSLQGQPKLNYMSLGGAAQLNLGVRF